MSAQGDFSLSLIRHSLTEGNLNAWCYGATDLPLIPEGEALLREYIGKGVYPSAEGKKIYTSGMLRAEQTLEEIYGDVPHEALSLLREYDFGEFECKTHEFLTENDPRYGEWLYGDFMNISTPGGESFGAFKSRVKEGFGELLSRREDAIVVSHGGVIAAAMCDWFGEEKLNYYQWTPEPARGYEVRFSRDSGGNIKAVGYEHI